MLTVMLTVTTTHLDEERCRAHLQRVKEAAHKEKVLEGVDCRAGQDDGLLHVAISLLTMQGNVQVQIFSDRRGKRETLDT